MSEAKHPDHVLGYNGTIEELAKAVGNMNYSKTEEFIGKLADDIKRQADDDFARGRINLAFNLYETANKLYDAKDKMNLVWKICEPFMKEK